MKAVIITIIVVFVVGMIVAIVAANRANPVFIDVDAAAEDSHNN